MRLNLRQDPVSRTTQLQKHTNGILKIGVGNALIESNGIQEGYAHREASEVGEKDKPGSEFGSPLPNVNPTCSERTTHSVVGESRGLIKVLCNQRGSISTRLEPQFPYLQRGILQ